MTITVSAFRWVPEFAQGYVRDLRVRWALEEAGLAYEERLIDPADQTTPEYRALQPFGQVPSFEEDRLTLFESGAILLHIAERSPALSPSDAGGRARMVAWMFAALNSVEPVVGNLADIDIFHSDEDWARQRRTGAVEIVKVRLGALNDALGDREHLEDRFTAADILMTTVLRDLGHTDILAGYPSLDAYRERCMARPAFQKALADQLAVFAANAPPDA